MIAFCRRKVDFPAMFGPVISHSGRASDPSAPASQSFATKAPPVRRSAASTTG
jgi:hypothetical protein